MKDKEQDIIYLKFTNIWIQKKVFLVQIIPVGVILIFSMEIFIFYGIVKIANYIMNSFDIFRGELIFLMDVLLWLMFKQL